MIKTDINNETPILKDGYKQTKLGWIPEDWSMKLLNEIGEFSKGKGIAKKDILEDGIEGLPCIRYAEIYTLYHNYTTSLKSKINQESAESSNPIEKGDILFAGSGETLGEIGKSIAYIGTQTAYAGGDINIFRQQNQDSQYLGYLFNTDVVRSQLFKIGQGHSVVHIYSSGLKKVSVPLPPLPEQQKITSILNIWDKAIAAQEKLIAEKQALKKGLMQQLLTGKKRFAGFTSEWEEVTLSKLFFMSAAKDMLTEKFNIIQTEKYKFPVYSNSLSKNGLYGYYDFFQYEANKITVTARGSLGCAIPRFEKFNGIGRLLILTPKVELDLKFISEYINNVMRIFVESTGVPQLTAPQFSNYKITLPEISEQKKIASVLNSSDIDLEKLKQQLNELKTLKQGLMQQLLTGQRRVKN